MYQEEIVKVLCPKCKGKGHRLDIVGVACLTIIGPFVAIAEQDDDPRKEFTATRKICANCRGKGYIKF